MLVNGVFRVSHAATSAEAERPGGCRSSSQQGRQDNHFPRKFSLFLIFEVIPGDLITIVFISALQPMDARESATTWKILTNVPRHKGT